MPLPRETVSRLLGAIFHRDEVLSLQLLTGAAYLLQSGQTVADIHLFGAAAGRLCRFLLGKNYVEQAGAKSFRRIVLVLVFLIGLTTLGKFVGQISR